MEVNNLFRSVYLVFSFELDGDGPQTWALGWNLQEPQTLDFSGTKKGPGVFRQKKKCL